MAPPLVTRATNDLIPASDHNDVKAYIEDGSYRINTNALSIQGTTAIDSSGNFFLKITSQARGDILYYNGTNWVRLAASTAGYKLQTNGAGADPSFNFAGSLTPWGTPWQTTAATLCTASAVSYSSITTTSWATGTEANAQTSIPYTGTLRRYAFWVAANTLVANATATLRKNGADVSGSSVTIPTGQTNQWFIGSGLNTSVTPSDLLNIKIDNTGGTGAITGKIVMVMIEPTTY